MFEYVVVNPPIAVPVTRLIPLRSASATNVVPIIGALSSEDREEREWDAIVSKPRVRNALERMAAEALRQRAAGETVEGGFGLE